MRALLAGLVALAALGACSEDSEPDAVANALEAVRLDCEYEGEPIAEPEGYWSEQVRETIWEIVYADGVAVVRTTSADGYARVVRCPEPTTVVPG